MELNGFLVEEEINELFKTKSGSIYSSAAALKLELSSNLPYYGTFNSTGGGGSRWNELSSTVFLATINDYRFID